MTNAEAPVATPWVVNVKTLDPEKVERAAGMRGERTPKSDRAEGSVRFVFYDDEQAGALARKLTRAGFLVLYGPEKSFELAAEEIESTPRRAERVIIRKEKEPRVASGYAFRAYYEDGTPLYLGSETFEGVKARVLADNPKAIVVDENSIDPCSHSHPATVPTTPCDPALENPLVYGPSDSARGKNIATLRREGYDEKQAAAIAYRIQRDQQRKRGLKVTPGAREDFAVVERDVAAVKKGRIVGDLHTPRAIYDFCAPMLASYSQEVFLTIPLDIRGVPLSDKPFMVAMGQHDRVGVETADAIRPVLETNAHGAVFVHNHPSGRAKPSKADKDLTKKLKEALAAGAPSCAFLDHIVVGGASKEYYSFTEEKLYKP